MKTFSLAAGVGLAAALMFTVGGLSGCASAVVMKYEPTATAEPVQDGLPRVYLAAADDATGGFKFDGVAYVPPTGPLADLFRASLLTEFNRIGLPLATDQSQAGILLYATLKEATVSWGGGTGIPVDGVVKITMTFRDKNHRSLLSTELVGRGRTIATGGGAAIGGAPGRAANAAFADAIGKIGPLFDSKALTRALLPPPPVSEAPQAGAPRPLERAAPPAARSDVDELPAAAAEFKNRHAVVIGVERYRENLPRADFAAGDARLAAEYYKRVLGIPAENVALLIDDHATNVDLQKYFERWLPNRVKEGDEVYVYFSGHGSPNLKTGDAYLVPYDGDPTYLEQTGYPIKKMYDQLAKLPAKRIVVALDSCFSGAGGRSVLAKGARPLVMAVAASSLPGNMTVIAAAAGDQISNSYQEKGHGLFTYYFLKGLKEKGSDLKAVYGYLKPEVARVAREQYNTDQDPQWRQGK